MLLPVVLFKPAKSIDRGFPGGIELSPWRIVHKITETTIPVSPEIITSGREARETQRGGIKSPGRKLSRHQR